MSDRCLVDTNVLVHSVDVASVHKSRIARSVLARLFLARRAVTTPQVIAEFQSNTTRPKGRPMPLLSVTEAAAWLHAWLEGVEFVDLTRTISIEALRAASTYRMNIYDAQMWAVARTCDIPILLTEDLQSQAEIEGVRYVNPFSDSFELADIGL